MKIQITSACVVDGDFQSRSADGSEKKDNHKRKEAEDENRNTGGNNCSADLVNGYCTEDFEIGSSQHVCRIGLSLVYGLPPF